MAKWTLNKEPMLTEEDMAALRRGWQYDNEMAALHYRNGMFVMAGPSGIHTLHGDTTDLERLNAHWSGFCADTRNQFSVQA